MSSIVVQKYGGSSVADATRIKRVAERIASTRKAGNQVCVVVSAMGDTTDQLVERAREISDSPPRRELDMLLTCGERASMALLSMAVHELGYEAISFTGSQCGIMTNDRHSGARIIEVRPVRVEDELHRGRVVIVAGFQGVSYKREITTLGRGGSDTTAVALAAALGAEYCEICSDVDGIYSADPRVVDAARLLDAISCDEMLELAAHGARVLHTEAVEFARRSGIALYARGAVGDSRGTRVDAIGSPGRDVSGVTGQKRLLRLRTSGAGAIGRMLSAATATGADVQRVVGDDAAAELWLSTADLADWPARRGRLDAAVGDSIELTDGLGAVSVIGAAVGSDPVFIARVHELIAEAGVAPISIASSPLRITIYCGEASVDPLTAALHAALCLPG